MKPADRRVLDFFVSSRRFANLFEKENGVRISPQEETYVQAIDRLRIAISLRLAAIERAVGQPEILTVSTEVSPGNVVFRFHRSQTYVAIPTRKVVNETRYDDRWDRPYVHTSRVNYSNLDDFIRTVDASLPQIQNPDPKFLICRGTDCPFFRPPVRHQLKEPREFTSLSANDQRLILELYRSTVSRWPDGWSPVWNKRSKFLTSAMYQRGGLSRYLTARRIPTERWGNYRTSEFGEILVNLKDEPFESTPWGSRKIDLVLRLCSTLNFLRTVGTRTRADEVFLRFLGTKGRTLAQGDLYLLEAPTRLNAIDELRMVASQLGPDGQSLGRRLAGLNQQLEQDYAVKVVARKRALLTEIAQLPQPQDNFFELDGIRVPLVDFQNLFPPVQEYLKIDARLAGANGQREFFPGDSSGSISLYRAPFNSESESFHKLGYLEASTATNFEPSNGLQVQTFRSKPDYSGEVFEVLNIPKHLVATSPNNSLAHVEFRLRHPVRISRIRILP